MNEQDSSLSARVPGVDPHAVPERVERVLESQRKKWGAPLANHLLYARCPEIFAGARAMWGGLDRSGLIDGVLTALINRRVALLNQCHF